MAIASVGTLGTGVSSVSSTSYTLTTATNTLAAGDFALLVSVTDNTSTADADTNNHTSVTGGTGTWTKLGEYTNGNGAAAAGVTTSLWLFEATGAMAVGTVITMNLSAACVDKAAQFWKFTKAAGTSIASDATRITNGIDANNGFGSVAFTGLPSKSRLYFRALGKEANSTTAITPSTNFTGIAGNRSRNNASAVLVRAEFRINTSTGETSNPTLVVTGDTAAVFVALSEVNPIPAATMSCRASILPNTTTKNTIPIVQADGVGEIDISSLGFAANNRLIAMRRAVAGHYYSDDLGATSFIGRATSLGPDSGRVLHNSALGRTIITRAGASLPYSRSDDNVTFTDDTLGPTTAGTQISGIAFNGSMYLCGHQNGGIYTSTDGDTWTQKLTTGFSGGYVANYLVGSQWAFYFAQLDGGDTALWYTLDDGASIQSVALPFSITGVGYSDGLYAVSTYGGRIYTSSNLTSWTLAHTFSIPGWTELEAARIVGFKGRFYVQVNGDDGTQFNPSKACRIYSSTDAVNWTLEATLPNSVQSWQLNLDPRDSTTPDSLVFSRRLGGGFSVRSAFELQSAQSGLGTAAFTAGSTLTASLSVGFAVRMECKANFKRSLTIIQLPQGLNAASRTLVVGNTLVIYNTVSSTDAAFATHNGKSFRRLGDGADKPFQDAWYRNQVVDDLIYVTLPTANTGLNCSRSSRNFNKFDALPYDGFNFKDIRKTPGGFYVVTMVNVSGIYRGTSLDSLSLVAGTSGIFYNLAHGNPPGRMCAWAGDQLYQSLDEGATWSAGVFYAPSQSGDGNQRLVWTGSFWYAWSNTVGRVWISSSQDPAGVWDHVITGKPSFPMQGFFVDGRLRDYYLDGGIPTEISTANGFDYTVERFTLPDSTSGFSTGVPAKFGDGIWLRGAATASAIQTVSVIYDGPALIIDNIIFSDGFAKATITADLLAGAQPLIATPQARATLTAALTTQINLAASAAALATQTANLQTGALLAAAPAALSTITANLQVGVRFAAVPAALSTLTANLQVGVRMAAAPAAISTLSGALNTQITLSASPAALSVLTADLLTGGNNFASTTLAGTSALSAALTTSITPSSSLLAVSTASAALTTAITPAASMQAVAVMTAALLTNVRLAASAQAIAASSAALTTSIRLAAAPAATSTLTANLRVGALLTAAPASTSALTAALSTDIRAQAALLATSAVSANLITGGGVAATATAMSTLTAALTTAIRAQAAAQAISTITASLQVGALLSAAPAARATVTADLSVGSSLGAAQAARSTLTAALTTQIRLAATQAARSTLTADLLVPKTLAASALAKSALTASLTTSIRMSSAVAARATLTADLQVGSGAFQAFMQAACGLSAALDARITLQAEARSDAELSAAIETQLLLQSLMGSVATLSASLRILPAYQSAGLKFTALVPEVNYGALVPPVDTRAVVAKTHTICRVQPLSSTVELSENTVARST